MSDTTDFSVDDDFSFDDWDEFESDDLDEQSRDPITEVKDTMLSELSDNSATYARTLAEAALPEGYKSAGSAIDETVSELSSSYDEAIEELKGPINDARKTLASAVDILPDWMMGSETKEKVSGYISPEDEPELGIGGSPTVDKDQMMIADTLSNIFSQERKDKIATDTLNKVASTTSIEVQSKGFESQLAGLSEVSAQLSNLAAYNNEVDYEATKKSLELQFKQYFVARDTHEIISASSADILTNLKAIKINTAIPDYNKSLLSEDYKEIASEKLLENASESLDNFTSGFTSKLRENLKGNLKGLVGSIKDSLSGFSDNAGQLIDAASNDEDGMMKQMLVGMFLEGAAKKTGDLVAPALLEKYPELYEKADEILFNMENAPAKFSEMASELQDTLGHVPFLGDLLNAIPSYVREEVKVDDLGIGSEPVPFTMDNNKSINEIIPGFLSRILQQVTEINTGQSVDREVYSRKTGEFVSIKDESGKVLDRITKMMGSRAALNTDATIGAIDKDNVLNETEKKELARILIKESFAGNLFDLDNFEYEVKDGDEFDGLRTFLQERNEASFGEKRKMADSFKSIAQNEKEVKAMVKDLVDSGNSDLLAEAGLFKFDKDFNRSFDSEAVFQRIIDITGNEKSIDLGRESFANQMKWANEERDKNKKRHQNTTLKMKRAKASTEDVVTDAKIASIDNALYRKMYGDEKADEQLAALRTEQEKTREANQKDIESFIDEMIEKPKEKKSILERMKKVFSLEDEEDGHKPDEEKSFFQKAKDNAKVASKLNFGELASTSRRDAEKRKKELEEAVGKKTEDPSESLLNSYDNDLRKNEVTHGSNSTDSNANSYRRSNHRSDRSYARRPIDDDMVHLETQQSEGVSQAASIQASIVADLDPVINELVAIKDIIGEVLRFEWQAFRNSFFTDRYGDESIPVTMVNGSEPSVPTPTPPPSVAMAKETATPIADKVSGFKDDVLKKVKDAEGPSKKLLTGIRSKLSLDDEGIEAKKSFLKSKFKELNFDKLSRDNLEDMLNSANTQLDEMIEKRLAGRFDLSDDMIKELDGLTNRVNDSDLVKSLREKSKVLDDIEKPKYLKELPGVDFSGFNSLRGIDLNKGKGDKDLSSSIKDKLPSFSDVKIPKFSMKDAEDTFNKLKGSVVEQQHVRSVIDFLKKKSEDDSEVEKGILDRLAGLKFESKDAKELWSSVEDFTKTQSDTIKKGTESIINKFMSKTRSNESDDMGEVNGTPGVAYAGISEQQLAYQDQMLGVVSGGLTTVNELLSAIVANTASSNETVSGKMISGLKSTLGGISTKFSEFTGTYFKGASALTGALGGGIGSTLSGAGRGIGSILGGGSGLFRKGNKDIYVKGSREPLVTSRDLKQGKYFDQETGKVVKSLDDIKGPIVDEEGSVVISQDNIEQGLYDQHGDGLLNLSNLIRKPFDFIIDSQKSTIGFVNDVASTAKNVLGGVLGRLTKVMSDVYVGGEESPRLLKLIFKNGGYFSRSGKVLSSPGDIDGEVLDSSGNVVLSKDDIAKGIFDHKGRPIGSSKIMAFLKNVFGGGISLAKGIITSGFKTGNAIVGGGAKAIGNAVGLLRGDERKSVTISNGEVLSNIYEHMQTKWPLDGPMKQDGSDDHGDNQSNPLPGVPFNDLSGEEDEVDHAEEKEKSWKEHFKEKIAERKRKREEREKKRLEGTMNDDPTKDGKGGFTLGGVISAIVSLGGTILGGLKALGAYLLGGLGAKSAAGFAGDMMGPDLPDGDRNNGKKTNKPKGKPKGKFGRAFQALKSGGSKLGGFAKRALPVAGRFIGKKVALAAAGTAAAVVGAPFVATALAIGGAAWTAYEIYDWLTDGSKDAPEPLERYRFMQYGIDCKSEEHLAKIRASEEYILDNSSITDKGLVVNVSPEEILKKVGGIWIPDIMENPQEQKLWSEWFSGKLYPILNKHLSVLRSIDDIDLEDADDDVEDEADKITYLKLTMNSTPMRNGSVMLSPIPGKPSPYTKKQIFDYANGLVGGKLSGTKENKPSESNGEKSAESKKASSKADSKAISKTPNQVNKESAPTKVNVNKNVTPNASNLVNSNKGIDLNKGISKNSSRHQVDPDRSTAAVEANATKAVKEDKSLGVVEVYASESVCFFEVENKSDDFKCLKGRLRDGQTISYDGIIEPITVPLGNWIQPGTFIANAKILESGGSSLDVTVMAKKSVDSIKYMKMRKKALTTGKNRASRGRKSVDLNNLMSRNVPSVETSGERSDKQEAQKDRSRSKSQVMGTSERMEAVKKERVKKTGGRQEAAKTIVKAIGSSNANTNKSLRQLSEASVKQGDLLMHANAQREAAVKSSERMEGILMDILQILDSEKRTPSSKQSTKPRVSNIEPVVDLRN